MMRFGRCLVAVAGVVIGGLASTAAAKPIPIAIGDTFSGEISDPEVTSQYAFDAAAGAVVFVHRLASSNYAKLNWTLQDSYGRVLASRMDCLCDLGPIPLMGGSYVITVLSESGGLGTYEASLTAVLDTTEGVALGDALVDGIEHPGQVRSYTFPAALGDTLFADSNQTSNYSGLNWELRGPQSEVVFSRTSSLYDVGPVPLMAGLHTLRVLGEGAATGTFEATLVQVPAEAAAGSFAIDVPVQGAIEAPGQSLSWVGELPPGGRVYVDVTTTSNASGLNWRLERPDGTAVNGWTTSMSDFGPTTIAGGSYRLRVTGEGHATGTFELLIRSVDDAVVPIVIGEPFSAAVTTPGQRVRHPFSAAAGTAIFLNTTAAGSVSGLNWLLTDAVGRRIIGQSSSIGDHGRTLLMGGDGYTLTLLGEYATTSDYTIVLSPIIDGVQAVAIGAATAGAIASPGQEQRYSFTATAGQIVTLDVLFASTVGGLNLQLYDSHGRVVVPRTTSLVDQTFVPLVGGSYTMTVLGEGDTTGNFSFRITDIGTASFSASGTAIALDTPVSATIAAATDDVYAFTLAEPTRIYLDLLSGADKLYWTLKDPAGRAVVDHQEAQYAEAGDRGPWTLAAGTYELTLSHATAAIEYEFSVRAVEDSVGTFAIDEEVSGGITTPGGTATYTVDIPEDTSLYLDLLSGEDKLYWTLRDPVGQPVFSGAEAQYSNNGDRGPWTLRAGTYTLTLDPSKHRVPTWTFRLRPVLDGSGTFPIDGTPFVGALTSQGSVHRLTAEVTEATSVFFDVLKGHSGLLWKLEGPSGQVLFDASAKNSSADRGPYELEPGTWTLTLNGSYDTLPDWELRAAPIATTEAASIEVGQVVEAAIPGPAAVLRYTLSLAAPQRLYLDNLLSSTNARWTLTNPAGRRVLDDASANGSTKDFGPRTFGPGLWSLTVRATGGVTPDISFTFAPVENVDYGAVPIAQITKGEIGGPGATSRWQVTPETDGQSLIFDLLANSQNLSWRATDPVGHDVFGLSSATGWTKDKGPYPLAFGEYSILFDGSGANTPQIRFRVKDADETPVAVPNGCASCSDLDVVFIYDTSGSMVGAAKSLCELTAALVAGLESQGIPIRAKHWGIVETTTIPCIDAHVLGELGDVVPGDPPPHLAQLGGCIGGGDADEDWALATAIVADGYDWAPGAVRLIVPVSDEGPYCGAGLTASDEEAIDYAVTVAVANEVVVSPIIPGYVTDDPHRVLAELLADGTGGVETFATFEPEELLQTVTAVAGAACETQQDDAVAPTLEVTFPTAGASFPPGSQVTIQGQTTPVNPLRKVLDVSVDGAPSQSFDAAGRFFHTVTIEEGENTFALELVEACGNFPSTLTLVGAPPEEIGLEAYADVGAELAARWTRTTFSDGAAEQLLTDAAATHVGDRAVDGPVLMVLGPTLHAAVSLATADGFTDAGEPYVEMVPLGETLSPGEQTSARPLAFDDAQRVHVFGDVHWLAPKNHAPWFVSAPVVGVAAGQPWTYAAQAHDPDGHAVTISVVVGPGALALDDAGVASWSPGEGDVGAHQVSLVADDGHGGTAIQTFSLSVSAPGSGQPPLFVTAPKAQAAIGATYAYDADAVDPDGGEVGYEKVQGPDALTVAPDTGLVAWSFALPGNHVVGVRAVDDTGAAAVQTWTLTVGDLPANPHAPLITSVPPTIAAVGAAYLYQVVATDLDGDPLLYSLDEAPAGMTVDPLIGRVLWTPTEAQLGEHPVLLTVSDGLFGETQQSYVVIVLAEPPNTPPWFLTSPGGQAVAGLEYNYDADAADPEGGAVVFELIEGPAGAAFDVNTGALGWTPDAAQAGLHTLAVRAIDPDGAQASQVWLLDVRAENEPPAIWTTPGADAYVGGAYVYAAKAKDPDGDTMTWSLVNAPAGVTIDPVLGRVDWIPGPEAAGDQTLIVRVADCCGGEDTQTWTIAVVHDEEPPVVLLQPSKDPACPLLPVTVCVSASDDVALVGRTLEVGGELVGLDAKGCKWLYRPDQVDPLPLKATATDGAGHVTTAEMALVFEDCSDPEKPVVELHSPAAESVIVAPTEIVATISDNEPQNLTWTVAIAPVGSDDFKEIGSGLGPVDEGVIANFDPTLLANGTYRVQIVGNDGFNTGGIEFRLSVAGDMKLGNFAVTLTDLAIAVAGIPLSVSRTYDSLDTQVRDFGVGWSFSLSASVSDSAKEVEGDDLIALLSEEAFSLTSRVYVTRPDGRRVGFTFDPENLGYPTLLQHSPKFKPDPGVTDTLEAIGPTKLFALGAKFYDFIIPYNPEVYILKTQEGLKYTISEVDGLQAVEDVNGNTLEVNSDGVLSSTGVALTFVRDAAGRITEIIEPEDETTGAPPGKLTYTYDAAGNLVSSADAAGQKTEYFYELPDSHPHYLTRIEDPLGRPITRNVFDDEGRLIGQCDAGGDVATLEGCITYDYDVSGGISTVVDARGFETERLWDADGNVVLERRFVDDVEFVEIQATYDAAGRPLQVTDIAGGTWGFAWDERGNLLAQTDAAGNAVTQTYGPCDKALTQVDAVGSTTYFEYDAKCRLTNVTDPLGGVTELVYDAHGHVVQLIDAEGAATTMHFDGIGRPTGHTDALGRKTTRVVSTTGDLLSSTDADGRTMTMEYDAAHRLTKSTWDTDPPRVETYQYNAADQMTLASGPDQTTAVTYYPTGLIEQVAVSDVPGAADWTMSYEYDGNGNPTRVVDSYGGITEMTYDGLDRVVRVTQSGAGVNEKRVDIAYGPQGGPSEIRRYADLAGEAAVVNTFYEYDVLGRTTGIFHRLPDDTVVHDLAYERDALGNVVELTDEEGTSTFQYDGLRRMLAADRPDGGPLPDEAYSYDSVGNRVSSHLSQSYTYSADLGEGGHELRADDQFDYAFDLTGNLVAATNLATGDLLELTYDHRSRATGVALFDAAGGTVHASSWIYDAADRRVAETGPLGTTSVVFDRANPILRVEPGGSTTRRLYGPRIDFLLADEVAGVTRWYLTDVVGTPRDIVNDDGELISHLVFDTFGQLVSPLAAPTGQLFNAREFDPQTSLGYFRARLYDPRLGRFLQTDSKVPFRYEFAENNALLYTDPLGTSFVERAVLQTKIILRLLWAKKACIGTIIVVGGGATAVIFTTNVFVGLVGAPAGAIFESLSRFLKGVDVVGDATGAWKQKLVDGAKSIIKIACK